MPDLLRARGFGRRWTNWIAGLLATSSTKIGINGDLSDTVYHRRGFRQGDPLSPLLFVIVMDSLARLIEAVSRAQVLPAIGTVPMPHRISMYADDIMLFINPSRNEMHAAITLLDLFQSVAGLWANWAKSEATPIACTEDQIGEAVVEMN